MRSGQVDPILDEMDSIMDEVVEEEATDVARQVYLSSSEMPSDMLRSCKSDEVNFKTSEYPL